MIRLFVTSAFAIFLLAGDARLSAQEKKIDFAHDILPTLKKRCAKCHSNGTYKNGFSIDTRDAILDSGAVELGDSDDSDLIDRITSEDEDYQMPPEGDRLSAKEIDQFKKWIDEDLDWTSGFTFRKREWKAPLGPRRPKLPAGPGNPIDRLLGRYFAKQKISEPPAIDDATFLRRVYLDLIGMLPTVAEQKQFLADPAKDKRQKMIASLLNRRHDYADHWMTFWNDLLRNDYAGTGYIDGGRKQITQWLHQSLYENKPYDQFVRELIAPSPESDGFIRGIRWRGNVNASQVREVQFAQNVSQVFLGENLKCASCHDSFINDWKLKDAYGMAAIIADRPLQMFRCDKPTGKMAKAKFLWPELGEIDTSLNKQQRLELTAKLITTDSNGRFARTIVNRIWQRMIGKGMVEPVDMMSNRPFDEDLLDFLAVDLVDNRYDLKKTISLIANSRIYQGQSVSKQEPQAKDIFRGPQPRRMTAEQFIDSVWLLTGTAPGKRVAQIANYDGARVAEHFRGKWYWNRKNASAAAANESVVFEFDVKLDASPKSSKMILTCDNHYILMVNGKQVAKDSDWTTVESIDLKRHLKKGANRFQIIGKNLGSTANPAGLYVSLIVDRKPIAPAIQVVAGKNKTAAVELTAQNLWPTVHGSIFVKEQRAMGMPLSQRQVRASLVNSDALMRSLGRPNRDQVVTTRADQLSTLEALDLSNGRILYELIEKGASRLIEDNQSLSSDQMVDEFFRRALCREPTAKELAVVKQILGSKPNQQSVSDMIWAVIMLPEFQHVR